ncbi:MAG: type II toxin-antitoxin system VapC family toxin [Azonexus sp.]|jgi:tRNA(fMet)-specific endonuclease VapC|nr:type II toxin-antitoxin system VapC family toxin [Azonexus sp.]
MKRYMLDTNAVSHFIKSHPVVSRRIMATPMSALCLSAITGGELMFGLAKMPEAKRLQQVIAELLRRVDVLPWDERAMRCYGSVRAGMARRGNVLGPLDMLIAAHALAADAVLVTHDAAFGRVDGLRVEDWTRG